MNFTFPDHVLFSFVKSGRSVQISLRRRAEKGCVMDDRAAGLVICVVSTVLFAYYTVWVLVTPFIQPGHAVRLCDMESFSLVFAVPTLPRTHASGLQS